MTLKKELQRLCKLGVLRKCSDSTWISPTFIIPKKNGTFRFISDFCYLNKNLVCKPYPLPKIADVLQKLEVLSYATALDLNMGYYTARLDFSSQKLCTIFTPWGKYQYQRDYLWELMSLQMLFKKNVQTHGRPRVCTYLLR